jgi:hypothetical protein
LENLTANLYSAVADELKSILSEAFADVRANIDQALAQGWRLPPGTALQFAQSSCNGHDPEAWFNALFQQFTEQVTFPETWTVLEQITLLDDILCHRRGEGGLRLS